MLDWDDLRYFLALARHGTLAASARRLAVTQSTVSRRIVAMQEAMGVQLFQRTPDGYALTQAGESILAHVERVEAEALSVERAVAGYDSRLSGTVRVFCSQFLASHLLAPSFSALHASHPGLVIESYTGSPDNPFREHGIEIALRMTQFEQNDVIVRRLGSVGLALYGCVSYLASHGLPKNGDGFAGHRLIHRLDANSPEQDEWMREHAPNITVAMRTDSYETRFWAAYSGAGLAILPRFLAAREPVLQRVVDVPHIPSGTIWLGVLAASRNIPRVRLVLDCIADAARNRAELLEATEPPAAS